MKTKLEQQHYDAIKEIGEDWNDSFKDENGKVWEAQYTLTDYFNKESAATKAAAITQAHLKKILEWLHLNPAAHKPYEDFKEGRILSEDLIELYFKFL